MNLEFTFASFITVLVQGAILVEGTPKEISTDPLIRDQSILEAHMPEQLLSLRNVTVDYSDALAIDDVSLDITEGADLARLGRNSVSKSNLIQTIINLTRQMSGSIF